MKRGIYVKAAAAALSVLMLAGCGASAETETTAAQTAAETEAAQTEEAASSETAGEEAASEDKELSGELTIYTSVPQDMADTFQRAFQEKYPDITVNVYRATSGEVLTKMKTEKEAGQMSSDVVWVADFSSADSLKDIDLLAKYESPEGEFIADELKDAEGYYYGSRVINMVLAYNTQIEAPSSWNDLNSPELSGKAGVPSSSSGSAFQFIGTMVSNPDFGWKYFEDFKANGGMQFKANNDVLQRIESGEILAGAVLDYMVTDMKNQGSPVDFVIPEEGAIAVASPIALVNGCSNEDNAKAFIDYVLSEEGQELLASLNTTPARSGIEVPEGVLSLDTLKLMPSDMTYISENSAEIKDQFNQLFGE